MFFKSDKKKATQRRTHKVNNGFIQSPTNEWLNTSK